MGLLMQKLNKRVSTFAVMINGYTLTYEVNKNPLIIFLLTKFWFLVRRSIDFTHKHFIQSLKHC